MRTPRGGPATYDGMASSYERLTNWYSRGRIGQAKLSQVEHVGAGDRFLCAGVGPGDDALAAAAQGAQVTCLDLSGRMLAAASDRLLAAGLAAEMIHGDVFHHHRVDHYDAVSANFLLDCYEEPDMRRLLAHLVGLVRPGGKLLIADVASPQGSKASRAFHRVYHHLAFATSWFQGLTPLWAAYDYPRYFPELGVDLVERQPFRLWEGGPILFEAIVGIRRP